jgi:hypothetical protein
VVVQTELCFVFARSKELLVDQPVEYVVQLTETMRLVDQFKCKAYIWRDEASNIVQVNHVASVDRNRSL